MKTAQEALDWLRINQFCVIPFGACGWRIINGNGSFYIEVKDSEELLLNVRIIRDIRENF